MDFRISKFSCGMVQVLVKLFIPIDHSSAIICLVYAFGVFPDNRLKVRTADQVSHAFPMSPRILGINVMKQQSIYMIILKSSMFRQNFARQTPSPTTVTLTMQLKVGPSNKEKAFSSLSRKCHV